MATTRTSRVYTISLPPDMALRAEALAKNQSRTMSELFREAFRLYDAEETRKTLRLLDEIGESANLNPFGYTEQDIPRLIQEVRQQARKKPARKAAAPQPPKRQRKPSSSRELAHS